MLLHGRVYLAQVLLFFFSNARCPPPLSSQAGPVSRVKQAYGEFYLVIPKHSPVYRTSFVSSHPAAEGGRRRAQRDWDQRNYKTRNTRQALWYVMGAACVQTYAMIQFFFFWSA